MRHLPFRQVDAFTTVPMQGNACAIVFDADGLGDEVMQAFALEMNLSETSFVSASSKADFRFRYFTPAEEIPLAGHPTIATVHALVEMGRIKLEGPQTAIRVELEAGVIDVEIMDEPDRSPRIVMSQKRPEFLQIYEAADVLPAFGLGEDDLLIDAEIQTVSTGTPQLMIPLTGHDALRRATLDITAYRELRSRGDFFSPHLFCLGGFTEKGDTSARHFGVPPDTLEDPFTGSATGGMSAYLWSRGLLDSPRLVAEQGHWMGRPGSALVEVLGPRDDIETVRVAGTAVTILDGEVRLPG